MTEPELMNLARQYDSLVDEAQMAIRAEFTRRGLEPPLVGEEEPEAVYRKLVTVRRYRDLSEAIVARAVIESAGLFCFLRDENMVRLEWQLSNLIGGIRLQVDEADAVAAEEILSELFSEKIALNGELEFVQPRCPQCDSLEVSFEGAIVAQRSPRFIY